MYSFMVGLYKNNVQTIQKYHIYSCNMLYLAKSVVVLVNVETLEKLCPSLLKGMGITNYGRNMKKLWIHSSQWRKRQHRTAFSVLAFY